MRTGALSQALLGVLVASGLWLTSELEAAPKRKGRRRPVVAEPTHHTPSLPFRERSIRCPDDMVAVAGQVCVDRYEATLVDGTSGQILSPFYPPHAKLATSLWETWSRAREAEPVDSLARTMPLPLLPLVQQGFVRPVVAAWRGSIPSGYVSGELAAQACRAANKRLCREAEWVTACRGAAQTKYPYGNAYIVGACNVFREAHPAYLLHGEFSVGLLDPRLNQLEVDGAGLLRPTGATPACVSRWGPGENDGIYDLVGNLDEWIDEPGGAFVGGFYARATRSGCDARVRAHPPRYFDYSTGVRCCRDPEEP